MERIIKWVNEHLMKLWVIIFTIIIAAAVVDCGVLMIYQSRNPDPTPADTVYINNQDEVMDAFIYGWRAGRSSVIRAVNSTGGVVNPDTVHKQIEAAYSRDTALFHLKLKAE